MAKKASRTSGKASARATKRSPAATKASAGKATSKKPATPKPATKKPATRPLKPSAKTATRASAGAKAGAELPLGGPFPEVSGKGPSAREIGNQLVAMFNRGEWEAIERAFWSPTIESVEGMTEATGMLWRGVKAVRAKGEEWMSQHTVHGAVAEGPYVGATSFGVRFKMDVEVKATGYRMMFDEVGVYRVRDGKIVREEFMYGSMTPISAPPKS
jgi:SnoaL-like domain